ncbi:HEPN domain-containing protein [Nocardia inohanensis]|uniref:HEPN domain-containing protein n=1 Tax=Nocardia inohanensis TaxID=209246 RepID=UPI0012FBCBC4|nr:HEPN domain-containing protein [Nocardia inohanensis]
MTSPSELASAGGQYGVVLNDIANEADFPFELGAGWTIDRASLSEVEVFRPQLEELRKLGAPFRSGLPYEASIDADQHQAVGFSWDLTPHQWRYTVVRSRDESPTERHKLDQALRIAPCDIRIAGWVEWTSSSSKKTVALNVPECVHYMRRILTNHVPSVPDFRRTKEIFELRSALDESKYPRIARALTLFAQYDELRDLSDTKFLAHFSVLESLLSHNPALNDSLDSITRQLRRNLKLLDHRMPPEENLGFDKFTRNATADQIIGKLYSIRSAAAHGGNTDEPLKWLNDRRPTGWTFWDHEYSYLRSIVQRILVAALREPQLITDLQGE